jgi:hypothetical protein
MSKTKEQLLEELKQSEKAHRYFKDHYESLCVAYDNVRQAHALDLEKHKVTFEKYFREMDVLKDNHAQAVRELGEAKEKVTAQEARIMVLETAMTSMALHIQIMIDQKKRSKS